MRVKTIHDEDFLNYRKPCMLIATVSCDYKCCREANIPISVCHNSQLTLSPAMDIPNQAIVTRYLNNPITNSVVFGGLEPFQQFDELLELISLLRSYTEDDIVIYTGFTEDEVEDQIQQLKSHKNIIIKFGRFVPNSDPVFDEVLGIKLASKNQYAKKIS